MLAPVPPGTPSNQRRVPTDWKPDDKPFEVEAELNVGFGGLDERYISKVSGKPFESVTVCADLSRAHIRQQLQGRRRSSSRS